MNIRKMLAGCLAFAILVSLLAVPVSAVSITQDSFEMKADAAVTVDGTTDQTVNVVLSSKAAMNVVALEGTFSTTEKEGNSYITLTNYTSPVTLTGTNYFDTESGAVVYADATLVGYAVAANGNVMTAVYTVAKDTPSGTYTVEFVASNIQDADDFSQVQSATYVATISVTNTASSGDDTTTDTDGYTATIAGASTNGNPVRVGDTLKVEVGADKEFYASEMTITYDSALVTYDATKSSVGDATVNSGTAGTLTLADYGNKKEAATKYSLAFTAIKDGTANFTVTSAKFGNGTDATTETLKDATCPDALAITIAKKQYAVTLNKYNETTIFAGAETVLEGETYTFTPETATGPYYDYTITSVKMGETDVTSSVTGDATNGWTISSVTGNLVITGTRTPKQYDVTWSGDGASKMDASAKAAKATYGTDFVFTIPTDVAKTETTDGYTYGATITIGGQTYSPNINGKTYTITGTSITGEVAIEVTEAVDAADKVSVNVSGSTDVTINNTTPSGDKVNVDKEQDVVVEVKPEDGYSYEVKVDETTVELTDNKYTIESSEVTENTKIEVIKTVNVTDVTNMTQEGNANGANRNFVNTDEKEMYLIKMPDHIKMQLEGADKKKAYTYDGQQMYWSETHQTYVITVFVTDGQAPAITHDKFDIVEVESTPAIEATSAGFYDVNMSGTVDANDAQLIWNMYSAWYDDFTTEVPIQKFVLADANGDEVLDLKDATMIINDILKITTTTSDAT